MYTNVHKIFHKKMFHKKMHLIIPEQNYVLYFGGNENFPPSRSNFYSYKTRKHCTSRGYLSLYILNLTMHGLFL